MIQKLTTLTLIALLSIGSISAKSYELSSPNGEAKITVESGDKLTWSVSFGDESIMKPSHIGLVVEGHKLSPVVRKATRRSVDELLEVAVPTKFSEIRDHYNEMTLSLKGGWAVSFRAYDNGVAYRFETRLGDKMINITNEISEYHFANDNQVYWTNEKSPEFISHCEANFELKALSKIDSAEYCFLPTSMSTPSQKRVVITESDLLDYPNLFLFGGDGTNLTAQFPKVALETRLRGDRDEDMIRKADYIARTKGERTLPWRIVMLGDDRSLLENTLTWQLATPQISDDVEWIKPGLISWEWWCALNVYGVDFEAGVNTETYKYYIDFASKYGIEYILLDEGWSESTTNVAAPRSDLSIVELVEYGKQRGVDIVLWTLWAPMQKDMEHILDTYQKWGVKGIKIDFMQRCDQGMVNFYEQVARECFKRKLLVDYHGSYKPAGLQRTYPNAMTFEGVYGSEHNKCSSDISPEHDLVIPFTRMAAGPLDYTPGATINATQEDFSIRWSHPMSQGTRAHQAAIYVVFESPLQMLCDSPSNYYREPEFTKFITSVPTTWDQTVALEAKAGDYLVIARRSGDEWFIAGLNDWSARDIEIALDFIDTDTYDAEIFMDGVNANVWAEDYKIDNKELTKGDKLTIKMANGGGWAARLTPKK